MRRIRLIQLRFFLSLFVLFVLFVVDLQAAEPTYWQDLRPVLRKYCTVCHSTRNLKELDVSGGLALDSYEAVVKDVKKPLLKAGNSQDSLMVQLVLSRDDEKRMPLGAKPLPEEAIGLLRRWIDSGAREGTRPDSPAVPVAASSPGRRGKLDVVLPTSAVPPRSVLGS